VRTTRPGSPPRFGTVRLCIGWLARLLVAFSATILVLAVRALLLRPSPAPVPMLAFALYMLWVLRRGYLFVPAVVTDAEGTTVRSESGRSGVFVRWKHDEAVVIWYDGYGGTKTAKVGIVVPDGFRFDNEGRLPLIEPRSEPCQDHRVPEAVRAWPVPVTETRSRRIARLISASGNAVTVFEARDLSGDVPRRLTGTAPWKPHQ